MNESEKKISAKAADSSSTGKATTSKTKPDIDLDSAEFYLNRELTWLAFNRRVLHEAQDSRTPLLERLKFIAIVSSNLDEFFMKRIGGLKEQYGAGVMQLTVDGRTPKQQIDECYEVVRDIESQKDAALIELLEELKAFDFHILNYQDLDAKEQESLRELYLNNIFPLVTPQSVDPAHPFPFISNLSLNLLVTLRHPNDQTSSLARIKVPIGSGVKRFQKLGEGFRYVRLEDIMANNLDLLFPGMIIEACEYFHATRNANTESEEANAEDLLALIEAEVRSRKFAPIVRVVVHQDMDSVRCGRIATELGLDAESDVFERSRMLAMRDLFELIGAEIPELHYAPHSAIDHTRLNNAGSIFHTIREAGSILLHHPYEAFSSSVERFLKEASEDPKVRAIKMTIYRTSSDTKIIEYLIAAARNGKQVAVAVELKARFDEAANIGWASRLEEAGIHVTYGILGLKTHCKVILVVRQDYSGLRRYAHIGTGNYHAGTAKIYTDLGMLTCSKPIGEDLTELFNYLTTGYVQRRQYRKILPAPAKIKKGLIDKIQREVKHQQSGETGHVQMKMNALEDVDITRALYKASQAGVKVDLVVRDTCRLRPGIKGLSETIKVISIVGQFLEHSRIYYFRNAGKEEYYIGSADMMKRNLESRVEILAPVDSPDLQTHLREILDINLSDQRAAWEMQSDGSYIQRQPKGKNTLSCQEELMAAAKQREITAKAATKLKAPKATPKVRRRNKNR